MVPCGWHGYLSVRKRANIKFSLNRSDTNKLRHRGAAVEERPLYPHPTPSVLHLVCFCSLLLNYWMSLPLLSHSCHHSDCHLRQKLNSEIGGNVMFKKDENVLVKNCMEYGRIGKSIKTW